MATNTRTTNNYGKKILTAEDKKRQEATNQERAGGNAGCWQDCQNKERGGGEKARGRAVLAEEDNVLNEVEKNKKKAANALEKAGQAMKEVESKEIQAMAIEARCKAEKEANKGRANGVIELVDSPDKVEEVKDTKIEGVEGDKEKEVVVVENEGAGVVSVKDLHCHKIGAATGTERTTKTPSLPARRTNSNKHMQVAQTPERSGLKGHEETTMKGKVIS